jgi:hypothetical protein
MDEARLAASMEAAALVRRVSANGDFAAILRRGDPERGSILLVVNSRGRYVACLQRALDFASGTYAWRTVGPDEQGSAELQGFLDHQARFDPDLWQIELDIALPERFIAETTA